MSRIARRVLASVPVGVVATVLAPRGAHAQDHEVPPCTVLCAPDLSFEPTLTIENLFARPRVEDVSTGATRRVERGLAFEAIFALGIPTQLDFVELTLEVVLAPFVQDNQPEIEGELNIVFLREEWTGGWVEAHFDVIDKLSPAERPGAGSAYTHKLNLELDVALMVFNWLRPGHWLRGVELEASLDYVATGLACRGDIVDGQRFLDDASPWSLSFLLVLPLAPLEPGDEASPDETRSTT